MATTCQDIINETQRLLAPIQKGIAVTLSSSYTSGGTTLAITDGSAGSVNTMSILPGTVLSVDLELFYVTGVVSGGVVPVSGAFQGSTAANHASGTLVWVNRRFTDFECFRQINNVLDDLSGDLYNIGECTITANAVYQAYDLTDTNTSTAISNYIEPIALRYKQPTPDRKYGTIPKNRFEVLPMGGTTVDTNFPSGYQLIVNGAGGWPGQQMIFLYKQGFTHFASYTSDAQTVAKLSSSMNDIPPMGAMIRMVAPREIQRNQPYSQPDGRLAAETPPGAISGSVNAVRMMYLSRVRQESERLKTLIGQFRRRF